MPAEQHKAPSFELRYMSAQYVSGFWFDNDVTGTSRTHHGNVWTNAFKRPVAAPYIPHGEMILSNETMSRSEVTYLPIPGPSPCHLYAERYKFGGGTHNMSLWVDYDFKAGHECFLLRHGDDRHWLFRLPAKHPMKCGYNTQKLQNFGTLNEKMIVNVSSVGTVCPDLVPYLVEARNRELTFIHPTRWTL